MRFESLKRVECVHGRGSVQLVAALPRSSVWISFEEGVGKEKGRKGRGRERRGRGDKGKGCSLPVRGMDAPGYMEIIQIGQVAIYNRTNTFSAIIHCFV